MAEERTLRVLATSGAFWPGFLAGGPIRAITQLVDTLPSNVSLDLITRDRDHRSDTPYPGLGGAWHARGRARIYYLNTRRCRQWLSLLKALRAQRYHYLYLNSIWTPVFSLGFLLLFRLRFLRADTLLLAPRGELSQGALSQKAGKKARLLPLLKWTLRQPDVLWHATSTGERDDIQRQFPGATVVLVADQTALPEAPNLPLSKSGEHIRLVFLSRISPMKNLQMAIGALSAVKTPVSFDVYGPVEDSAYWAACQEAAHKLPANVTFAYRGVVAPDDVQSVLGGYDAFLLPTLGENFGFVIAESLSSSCPVICSDRTPWTEVLRSGGGFVFDDMSLNQLQTLLAEYCLLSPESRQAARLRAGEAYARYRQDVREKPHLFSAIAENSI